MPLISPLLNAADYATRRNLGVRGSGYQLPDFDCLWRSTVGFRRPATFFSPNERDVGARSLCATSTTASRDHRAFVKGLTGIG